MLRINNLSKSFGDKLVLDSFSREFNKGTVTLITGKSGSGKTTLLRIIAGLEKADSGGVTLDEGATVSMMFQETRLLPWKNIFANIAAVTPKKDHDKIIPLLKKLGLENEVYSMPYELSGGMKRRVSLARTLLFPADIYLFDEPFTGLDYETGKAVSDIILKSTKGKIVIIVSHDSSVLPNNIETVAIGISK